MMRILLILGIVIPSLGCTSPQSHQATEEISPPVLTQIQAQSILEEAIALGKSGEQQENAQHYEEAIRLTRQAIFKAQAAKVQLNEAEHNLALAWLIRWHWQLGRILKAQGNRKAAIEAYQQALQLFVPGKNNFQWETRGKKALYQKMRQMFLQLTDLLLQRSASQAISHQQDDLRQVRETIEQLKVAGLENYFAECLTRKVKKAIDSFDAPQTAVIYPILLPERLELLVSFPHQNQPMIFKQTVSVTEETIRNVTEHFLIQLKKGFHNRQSKDYLSEAQQLYHWLISPLLSLLRQHHIHTLVFVPEDILNALPIAALHDGKQFLIQKFAVAITPTLNLTESSKGLTPSETKVLLNAITQAVQNYPKLPYVKKEIKAIKKWYQPNTLLDEQFTANNFAKHLNSSRYDLIHIISHVEFAEEVNNSFILTHSGKLPLTKLQNIIESSQYNQSIELLTLSACNTAKGDQAWTALGLSGVALKAGARSALATLWKVDDRATFHLIKQFYSHLNSSNQKIAKTKAQALQKAQQVLLKSKEFNHPFYWASLALIGNWL